MDEARQHSHPFDKLAWPVGPASVECLRFGHGPETLVAIHGFGDSAGLFLALSPSLSERYTVYALSLPYHGDTLWPAPRFSLEEVASLIERALADSGAERFTLMGYSLGGKISLKLAETRFAPRLDRLVLLAPDGVKTHPLYDVGAFPRWALFLAKGLLTAPPAFFFVTDVCYKTGLLTKFLRDFNYNHFRTRRQRRRFFGVAASIKEFVADMALLKRRLNQHRVPVDVFLGERDEVIRPSVGEVMAEGLDRCRVCLLPKGHLIVDEDLNACLGDSLAGRRLANCNG